MQVCPQCSSALPPELSRPSGEPRRCPHCNTKLDQADPATSELFDLPVPLRPLPSPLSSQAEEDALPVPLRPAHDYRSERPKSSPPHPPPLQLVSMPPVEPPEDSHDRAHSRQLPPPGVPMLSIGPTHNPPPSAAQITMPEQLGPGKNGPGSRPPLEPHESPPQKPGEGVSADRSTTNAKPLLLVSDTIASEPPSVSVPTERPASQPSLPAQTSPSQPPSDSAQMGRLAARAGSTQSAKPVTLTGRSPTPASQNSASSQPGEMPLSAMFSMAASRQSLTSQTPQALKLGWLIAGLALAALLLLLTILVLVERSREASVPMLPSAGTMQ